MGQADSTRVPLLSAHVAMRAHKCVGVRLPLCTCLCMYVCACVRMRARISSVQAILSRDKHVYGRKLND